MPISFSSISHGQIPVGFFNIETDMLLMDRYFFFSTDFCAWVLAWAEAGGPDHDERMVYTIRERSMIGNLAGAIHGFAYTGFIGEIYKLFPFPARPSGFKQKPYGPVNRAVVEKMIQPFAVPLKISIEFSRENRSIAFGDYVFSAQVFREIIQYVEAGGMPGWLNEEPPAYVREMMNRLAADRWWALATVFPGA